MQDQQQLQTEIQAYSSALSDPDLTLDEAMIMRHIIDTTEREIESNQNQLNELADRGFFGYSHPGGLTKLFYGYDTPTPPAHSPGHYTRQR